MKDIKVIDCKASDNEYLHKDFHGALCYAIKYLEDNYGLSEVNAYLKQVGRTYFKPLSEKIRADGLRVLETYFKDIFTKEGGDFEMTYKDNALVLKVNSCPAISHLKKRNLYFTKSFCLTTKVVNETICEDADYCCSCEYDSEKGKCIQKFWKRAEDGK